MRVLGIDYGTKRHGLAVSDPMGYTAQPGGLVERRGTDGLDEIAAVIEEKEVEQIVLGLPLNMDSTPGDHHDEVLEFGEKLKERFGLPVETIDERLTTVQAERALQGLSRKKRKARVDQMAAQLILQAWLDSR